MHMETTSLFCCFILVTVDTLRNVKSVAFLVTFVTVDRELAGSDIIACCFECNYQV